MGQRIVITEELREKSRQAKERQEGALAHYAETSVRQQIKSMAPSVAQRVMGELEKNGVKAIRKVGKLIESTNEDIATRNSHYTIDHILGKATQKSISLKGRINIDALAD